MPKSQGWYLKGEDHVNAKLSDQKVLWIRMSGLGLDELSARFGVSRTQFTELEPLELGGISRLMALHGRNRHKKSADRTRRPLVPLTVRLTSFSLRTS